MALEFLSAWFLGAEKNVQPNDDIDTVAKELLRPKIHILWNIYDENN